MGYQFKHVLLAVLPLIMSAFFYLSAQGLPDGASLLPKILAAIVGFLSITMIFNAKTVASSYDNNSNHEEITEKINVTRVMVFLVAIATYIYLIPIIGYFIITPIFMLALYLYFKAVSPIKALLISLGFSAFIYFLFVWFLKLPIPVGYLEQLMEIL